jgi:alpha-beta hydrolase superfamily lysophospholipase
MELREHRGTVPGPAGQPLPLYGWSAEVPERGRLVAVHGIGGHGGQFRGLAEHLAPRGWTVWAPDLPGHGHAPGPRGWVADWTELGQAVGAALDCGREEAPARPQVLLGHSLGGAVCLDLVLRMPAAGAGLGGLVLTNPALDAAGIAAWRVWVARWLSRLWPRLTLDTGIDSATSSRDPAALERYRSDPLRHSRCSARLGAGFLEVAAGLLGRAAELRLPLLMLQSGDDRVTAAAVSERFFSAAGSGDKTWRLYPESRHELFDDLDRDVVMEELACWLEAHGRWPEGVIRADPAQPPEGLVSVTSP